MWAEPAGPRAHDGTIIPERVDAIVEELRLALLEFRRTYNERWLIERHGHRSPAQFKRDQIDRQPMAA